MKKENKTDAAFSAIAAVALLFTTMLDPRVSAGFAILLLIGFSIYKFLKK